MSGFLTVLLIVAIILYVSMGLCVMLFMYGLRKNTKYADPIFTLIMCVVSSVFWPGFILGNYVAETQEVE